MKAAPQRRGSSRSRTGAGPWLRSRGKRYAVSNATGPHAWARSASPCSWTCCTRLQRVEQMSVVRMTLIREATSHDLPFLEAMLYEAFFWSTEMERPALAEMRVRPEFRELLADWGRPGDVAVLAFTAGAASGAAWSRSWTPAVHSYGFVDADTL